MEITAGSRLKNTFLPSNVSGFVGCCFVDLISDISSFESKLSLKKFYA
jgi:hypothetical protein